MLVFELPGLAENGIDDFLRIDGQFGAIGFFRCGLEREDEPAELLAEGEAQAGIGEFFGFLAFPFAEVGGLLLLVLEVHLFHAVEVELDGGVVAADGLAEGGQGDAESGVHFGVRGFPEFLKIFQQRFAIRIGQGIRPRAVEADGGTNQENGNSHGRVHRKISGRGQGGRVNSLRLRRADWRGFRAWIFAIPAHGWPRHPP